MKIAVYGGSFNPPHLGHVEAARTVAQALHPDKFLIIPDNLPPHKEMVEDSPTPEQRMSLCALAFAAIPGAEISDMEIRREGKSYTADTVDRLRALYPEDELFLVMGTDMLLSFEQWYRFRYLLEQCTLAVLARAEEDGDAIRAHAGYMEREYGARIVILPHAPLEMSSSDIRERLKVRLGSELLDDGVYSQIIRCRYYNAQPELSWLREKAYAYLKPKRIAHVAGCESEAVRLAMRWGEDPETAAEAGILHDITKKLNFDEQLILCGKYDIINDNLELKSPKLLHAKTGAALARDLFGVSDRVYEAIRWHTTGKPDMTTLEKIIYLADYIEPTRDFDGVEPLRQLCYEDLDAAMELGLRMTMDDLASKGLPVLEVSGQAYLWFHNRREG